MALTSRVPISDPSKPSFVGNLIQYGTKWVLKRKSSSATSPHLSVYVTLAGFTSLTELSLGESCPGSVLDSTDVADLFVEVAPNLRKIEFCDDCGHEICEEREMWRGVCDHMSVLRTASGRDGCVAFDSW
jgi:hypothetical protein